MRYQKLVFILLFLISSNAFALPKGSGVKSDPNAQTVLRADQIDADKVENSIVASGNVEITRETTVVKAQEVIYSKNGATIRAIGNVKIKNLEIGDMYAREAEINDDFSKGSFFDSKIFFNDGSYLFATRIDRQDENTSVLHKSIFSICPNDEIKSDYTKAGKISNLASLRSSKTTIDRQEGKIKGKHTIFRIYDIPVFYTPYSSITIPSKERQSGFLNPSYNRNNILGFGLRTPYYWNIAPNMDLTITPQLYLQNNQILVENDFRHLTSYGQYKIKFEAANNQITNTNDTTVVKRTDKELRWSLLGKGEFDFSKNLTADFDVNSLSDRDYMRDYRMNFWAYSLSKADLNYMNKRDYYVARTVRIQELENRTYQKAAPFIMPSLDSHIETKPFFSKEKLALSSNFTNIHRDDGLLYRRATLTPEAKVPFNIKGNLFDLGARVQNDFYWLENNYKTTPQTADYQNLQSNYKPELSANWRLPLIKKSQKNTLMFEPMANIVWSSFKKNVYNLPNEDSNNSELSVSNLFTNDRIFGFDRNEAGQRASVGAKSSLFNRFGEFGLTLGQSLRIKDQSQDVQIRGFADNNKSNYIGQAMYRAKKYFNLSYSFQLNESNLRNDVNQVTGVFSSKDFIFSADYLLLRRAANNPEMREQVTLSTTFKTTDRWKTTLAATNDLVSDRMLSRSITLLRDGCCTIFSFSVMENNPINLTKPQRNFSFLLTFKNL